MEIAAYSNLLAANTASAATTASQIINQISMPSFGAATLVALGPDALPVVGFPDYTQLGTSGLWQFDLAGVLSLATAPTPTQAVSEEQQKAEAATIQLALDEMNAGQDAAARQRIDELLADNPTNAAAIQVLGQLAQKTGDYARAEQQFSKAHALNPTAGYDNDAANARLLKSDDATVLARARAMVQTPARRSEGIRVLIALAERSPELTAAHLLLGDALLDSGDGNNGLMQYNAAVQNAADGDLSEIAGRLADLLASAPDAPFVNSLLGKVQLRQARYDDALASFTRAASLSDSAAVYLPDMARAYAGIGQARLARGDVTGALAVLEQARACSPTGREVKLALADAYRARADRATARNDFDAALEDFSRVAALLEGLGSQTQREQAAASAYALGQRVQRARIAAGGEIDTELLAFQAAYDLDSGKLTYKRKLADTRKALGDQHAAAGEHEQAAAAYQRACDLFRYDTAYRTAARGAYTAWGDEELANLNYDDAIAAYLGAYRLDTTDVASKQKLADGYTARGLDHLDWQRYADAAADFHNALLLFPDNATYQANYAGVAAWDD